MPVKDKEPEVEAVDEVKAPDLSDVPGFHVTADGGKHLGTYSTREDAQMFIDGHLAPQDIKAEIVEGKAGPQEPLSVNE